MPISDFTDCSMCRTISDMELNPDIRSVVICRVPAVTVASIVSFDEMFAISKEKFVLIRQNYKRWWETLFPTTAKRC